MSVFFRVVVFARMVATVMLGVLRRSQHAFCFRVGLFFLGLPLFFVFCFRGGLLGRREIGGVRFFVGSEAAILRGASGVVFLRFGDMLGDDGGFVFG